MSDSRFFISFTFSVHWYGSWAYISCRHCAVRTYCTYPPTLRDLVHVDLNMDLPAVQYVANTTTTTADCTLLVKCCCWMRCAGTWCAECCTARTRARNWCSGRSRSRTACRRLGWRHATNRGTTAREPSSTSDSACTTLDRFRMAPGVAINRYDDRFSSRRVRFCRKSQPDSSAEIGKKWWTRATRWCSWWQWTNFTQMFAASTIQRRWHWWDVLSSRSHSGSGFLWLDFGGCVVEFLKNFTIYMVLKWSGFD